MGKRKEERRRFIKAVIQDDTMVMREKLIAIMNAKKILRHYRKTAEKVAVWPIGYE